MGQYAPGANRLYVVVFDPSGLEDERRPHVVSAEIASRSDKQIRLTGMWKDYNYRTNFMPGHIGGSDNSVQWTEAAAWNVFYKQARRQTMHLRRELAAWERVLNAAPQPSETPASRRGQARARTR